MKKREPKAPAPKQGAQTKQDRLEQAIDALWPSSVPSPVDLPNKELCKKVLVWLREDCIKRGLPMLVVSDRTILRAACRGK